MLCSIAAWCTKEASNSSSLTVIAEASIKSLTTAKTGQANQPNSSHAPYSDREQH